MILATKGKDKESIKQLKQGSKKKISFSSAFVNFLANMNYTPTLGSKRVYTISSTWGPKLSNNTSQDS
jgi:hypothetical protein